MYLRIDSYACFHTNGAQEKVSGFFAILTYGWIKTKTTEKQSVWMGEATPRQWKKEGVESEELKKNYRAIIGEKKRWIKVRDMKSTHWRGKDATLTAYVER